MICFPALAVFGSAGISEHSITVDGRERSFAIAASEARGPAPLIIVLHGGGGSQSGPRRWGFTEAAEKRGWIAAYPSGWQGNWNDGRDAPRIRAQQEKVDDVKFIRKMVEEIDRIRPLDRSRIFATGVSNGGIFSFRLAREASDLLAGIAPVVGGIAKPLADDYRIDPPLSVFMIQGDADPSVPFGGGGIGRSAARSGEVIAAFSAAEIIRRELHLTGSPNEILLPDEDPDDGARVRRLDHPPGPSGHRFRMDWIEGGGHSLPSRRIPAGSRAGHCRDYDAVEAIMDFFSGSPPREPLPIKS
jgi:polyhydroxybutyrate depolymerase